jgi:hypothetical protein
LFFCQKICFDKNIIRYVWFAHSDSSDDDQRQNSRYAAKGSNRGGRYGGTGAAAGGFNFDSFGAGGGGGASMGGPSMPVNLHDLGLINPSGSKKNKSDLLADTDPLEVEQS